MPRFYSDDPNKNISYHYEEFGVPMRDKYRLSTFFGEEKPGVEICETSSNNKEKLILPNDITLRCENKSLSIWGDVRLFVKDDDVILFVSIRTFITRRRTYFRCLDSRCMAFFLRMQNKEFVNNLTFKNNQRFDLYPMYLKDSALSSLFLFASLITEPLLSDTYTDRKPVILKFVVVDGEMHMKKVLLPSDTDFVGNWRKDPELSKVEYFVFHDEHRICTIHFFISGDNTDVVYSVVSKHNLKLLHSYCFVVQQLHDVSYVALNDVDPIDITVVTYTGRTIRLCGGQ